MKEKFIITIKAENRPGLISQITGILNRKQLDIEGISATKTDISTIVMITVELITAEQYVNSLVNRISNIIEVYAVDTVKSNDAISQQVAYFKISKQIFNSQQAELLCSQGLQIINFHSDAFLLSAYGSEKVIRSLYNKMDGPYLLGFMKSGLIADTALIDNDEVRVIEINSVAQCKVIRQAA